jgi:hypothetical protein
VNQLSRKGSTKKPGRSVLEKRRDKQAKLAERTETMRKRDRMNTGV